MLIVNSFTIKIILAKNLKESVIVMNTNVLLKKVKKKDVVVKKSQEQIFVKNIHVEKMNRNLSGTNAFKFVL